MSDEIVTGIRPNEFSALLTALWFKNMAELNSLVAAFGGPTRCLARILLSKCSVVLCNEDPGSLALAIFILDMGVELNAPMRLRNGYTCTLFQILADRCSVVSPEGLKFLRRILDMDPDIFGMCPCSDSMECMQNADLRYPYYEKGTRNLHVAMISWPDEACSELLDGIKRRGGEAVDSIIDRSDTEVADSSIIERCEDSELIDSVKKWRCEVADIMREQIWMNSMKQPGKKVPTTLMGFSCFAGREATVRRLVLDFGMDGNAMTDDGFTPLHVSMYELENVSESWICETLVNLGANPLFRMKNRGSALSVCEGYLEESYFANNPPAKKKLQKLIHLMRQHIRFRMSLRMLGAGNGYSGSPLSQLGSDLMVQIANKLAPRACLLSNDQISGLYSTEKSWFTESLY
jgi:hypothetical protein